MGKSAITNPSGRENVGCVRPFPHGGVDGKSETSCRNGESTYDLRDAGPFVTGVCVAVTP